MQNEQRGWVDVRESSVKVAERDGYFVLAITGPRGGCRRYVWISRDEASRLYSQLSDALIADAEAAK